MNGGLMAGCVNPSLNSFATPYCFGDATEEQRQAFEAHLLECDYCWEEVQRLEGAIQALRSGSEVVQDFAAHDVVEVFGLSGRLENWFGGHAAQVTVGIVMYSLLYPLALLTEVAYEFDQLGRSALRVAPLMFLWLAFTSIVAFAITWRGARNKTQPTSSIVAGVVLLASPALLFIMIRDVLPTHPVVQATFQTYTAQAGFVKSIVLTAPVALLFMLLPFDFVLTLQRHVREDRQAFVLTVLEGKRDTITPIGTVFLRPTLVLAALCVTLAFSIGGTIRLFEGLIPSPQMNAFMLLALARSVDYVALWIGAFWWYSWALNEVRRECAAVTSIRLKA